MSSSSDLVNQAKVAYQEVPAAPRRHTAVVTCFDARVDPWRILEAGPGDVQVFRNAGGIVTEDVIRSLVISNHKFGVTGVNLIMHTDCGMIGLDQSAVEAELGRLPFDLGGFDDLTTELRRGGERLRSEPLLHLSGGVATYIYDLRDGGLRRQSA